MREYGLNPAASRLTTGNHQLYERLEAELRSFFKTETATLTSNGYSTNLIVAQALRGSFSHALIDERSHRSLFDSTAYLDCPLIRFAHADPAGLQKEIQRLPASANVLLLTDGLFGHNGRLAPVREYLEVLPAGGQIVIDDAHGAGTIGRHGRGTCEVLGIAPGRIIQTISLSKAFGVYGGAILGSRTFRTTMIERSGFLRGNTPLPLPLAAAALRAISVLRSDRVRRGRLQRNIEQVHRQCPDRIYPPSPIIALYPKTTAHGRKLSEQLLKSGIHPPRIRYEGEADYFRFTLSSEHRPTQIGKLVDILRCCDGFA
jgi:7-keto-8-aminopelargonate synthetase-like enzyme